MKHIKIFFCRTSRAANGKIYIFYPFPLTLNYLKLKHLNYFIIWRSQPFLTFWNFFKKIALLAWLTQFFFNFLKTWKVSGFYKKRFIIALRGYFFFLIVQRYEHFKKLQKYLSFNLSQMPDILDQELTFKIVKIPFF